MSETPEVKTFVRDARGLIEGITYVYRPDGRVDWRAMVNPKYLAINRQYEEEIVKKYGKSLPELTVSEVDDKYLIILLNGIKEIAALRGFTSVVPEIKFVSDTHCTVQTYITWIGNYETNFMPVTYGEIGGATKENTQGISTIYLDAIATNRAFVRAVRNFLGINVVGHDEISEQGSLLESDAAPQINPLSPHGLLNKTIEKQGLSFEKLKELAKGVENLEGKPDEWKVITEILPRDCMKLLSALAKTKKT